VSIAVAVAGIILFGVLPTPLLELVQRSMIALGV
jgi:hypothetical protein